MLEFCSGNLAFRFESTELTVRAIGSLDDPNVATALEEILRIVAYLEGRDVEFTTLQRKNKRTGKSVIDCVRIKYPLKIAQPAGAFGHLMDQLFRS